MEWNELSIDDIIIPEKTELDKFKEHIINNDMNEVMKYLLSMVNDKETLNICMKIAVFNDRIELVKLLIDYGADIHAKNDCVLSESIIKNKDSFDIVKFLIENGANISNKYDDTTPLIVSVHYGHPDIVKLLLENGADIHALDDYALTLSSRHGYYDIVKLLLESGADIHAEDDNPLREAVIEGHVDIVKLLVENGANNSINKIIMVNKHDVSMVSLLNEYGINYQCMEN